MTTAKLAELRSASPYRPFFELLQFIANYLHSINQLFLLEIRLDFPPSVTCPSTRDAPADLFAHKYADVLNLLLSSEHQYFAIGSHLARCVPNSCHDNINKLRSSVDTLCSAYCSLNIDGTRPLSLDI